MSNECTNEHLPDDASTPPERQNKKKARGCGIWILAAILLIIIMRTCGGFSSTGPGPIDRPPAELSGGASDILSKGSNYLETNQFQEALKCANAAILKDSRSVEARLFRASVYGALANSLMPKKNNSESDSEAYENMRKMKQSGDMETALSHYINARDEYQYILEHLDPDNPKAKMLLRVTDSIVSDLNRFQQ